MTIDPTMQPPLKRRGLTTRAVLQTSAGFAIGLLLILAAVALFSERIPALDSEVLSSAAERWRQQRPTAYRLEVAIGGKRSGRVTVEVQGDEITHMSRDGVTPARRETWRAWSVEGLFETLRQEIELAEHPQRSFGVAERSQIIERARFDPHYGYPIRYQRSVLGSDQDLDWRVVKFELVETQR